MRLLIVEDDPAISHALRLALREAGHAVDVSDTLCGARTALAVEPFDAMLLDLGLPDGDGASLLRELRARRAGMGSLPDPGLPVLILTARDGVDARIAGLDLGADDYLVKPFDPGELLARLRAMTRRRAGRASSVITFRDLVIDPGTHAVLRDGQPVPLGPREFALLLALVEASPQVLSRSRLQAALYGFDESLESNAIEVHVHHLRRKLGDQVIQTMRGVGYFAPREPAP